MYFGGFPDDRNMCNMLKCAKNDTDYDFIRWKARIPLKKMTAIMKENGRYVIIT